MGLVPLTLNEKNVLRNVTIVGMRFYYGAHEYLRRTSFRNDLFDQHLYLVPELDNEHDINAIKLHNGKQKIGSVSAEQAPGLKRLFTEWRAAGEGTSRSKDDFVVVCKVDRISSALEDFKYTGSIVVHGEYRVNERLARKYADKFRKE